MNRGRSGWTCCRCSSPVHETHRLPARHQRGGAAADRRASPRRARGLAQLREKRSITWSASRHQFVAAIVGGSSARRAETHELGAEPGFTAAVSRSRAAPGGWKPTIASARVVGMPSAAIAEQRTRGSTSAGPHGRRPCVSMACVPPFNWISTGRWRCVLAQQMGAAIAELARPVAELVAGRPRRGSRCPRRRCCRPALDEPPRAGSRDELEQGGCLIAGDHQVGSAGPRARGRYGSVAAGGQSCCRGQVFEAVAPARGAVSGCCHGGIRWGVLCRHLVERGPCRSPTVPEKAPARPAGTASARTDTISSGG